MATNKIRGITIELGADTSGLNKALTNVNKEIGQTQRELRDVEKLLKMDPGNTELLAQKQRMLADRVSETKDKLETLRKAQEVLEQEMSDGKIDQGQYDALQREIISCENELKQLEKDAAAANVTVQKIANAGEGLKKFGSGVSDVGKSLTRNVTVPMVGLGGAIIKTTADFDAQMSKVQALSKASTEDFEILRDKAREMGEKTKYSALEAAQAMEFMSLAGWDTTQMLGGIEGIMNLAAASGEDLALTSDIVTDALTAFGLQAEDSAKFADLLAQVSASSNTNVAMMGETFKYAATTLGPMGYTAEDTALAIGLMGNAGIKASQAGTALRGVMSRMAKPTDEVVSAMDRLDLSLANDEGEMYSLYDIMVKMREGFTHINMPLEEFNDRINTLDLMLEDGEITQKKYDKELDELIKQAYGAEGAEKARAAAMLAGKNAMSGMLAIVNASDEDFNKLKTAIDESGGAAQEMADIMMNNTSGKVQILISKLTELAISLGDLLIPVVDKVVEYLQDLTDQFNALDDSQKEMIIKAAAIVAALGPVLVVLGTLIESLGRLFTWLPKIVGGLQPVMAAFKALWAVILANPVVAVVVAITAAIVGLVALIATKGDEIQAVIQKIDNFLQNIFAKDWTEVFGPVLGGVLNKFMGVFKNTWDNLKRVLDGIIDFIRGAFTGNWERAWGGLKKIFGRVFDSLINLAKSPINRIISMINSMFSGINRVASRVGASLSIPTIPMLAKGGVVTSGSAIVGEAGAELLSVSNGAATVQPLTSGGNSSHTDITDLLKTYLPYLAEGNQIVLDSGALVGATAPQMNNALGQIAARAGAR